jgi:hypothetical protein
LVARRALLGLVVGACALTPAAAHAGTYDVYSCTFGGGVYGNNAWAAVNNSGAGDPSYRFERTTGPTRYRFRLKVVRQAGLPYHGGVSPVVSVLVRP